MGRICDVGAMSRDKTGGWYSVSSFGHNRGKNVFKEV
jgi:hypothetical protein